MNVNISNDNFDININYSEIKLKVDDKIKLKVDDKIKIKDVKPNYTNKKEMVDKMVKNNYSKYKKKREEVNKIHQEWIHPELNLFSDINLNKCVCKNCGNFNNIDMTPKKEKSYF
jgi:hypothetical protein